MALTQQTINIGTVSGDQTGDGGRVAMSKVNTNFTALFNALNGAGGALGLTGSVIYGPPTSYADWVVKINGNATAGSSYGLQVSAGTNASDFAVQVRSQNNTNNFLLLYGDGHGVLGYNGITNTIQWTAGGAVSIAAPSSGSTLTLAIPGDGVSNTMISNGGTSQAAFKAQSSGAQLLGLNMNSSNANYQIFIGNNVSANWSLVYNLGNDIIRVSAAGAVAFPQVSTTASAANAYLDNGASNNLLRSTSSVKYKTDLQVISDAEQIVMRLKPISYRSLAEADDKERRWYGLVAEEVADIDPQLVNLNENHEPDGVQYDRVGVLLLALVQEMHHKLTAKGLLQ